MTVETFPDAQSLAAHVAQWLSALARAKQGPFTVALSGGSTPRATYELLAKEDFPWDRTRWFFGDERFVPPDDSESNYRMAQEAMLYRAPEKNVYRVQTLGVTAQTAALAYETELKALRGDGPMFDVTLLGTGPRRPHRLALPRLCDARRARALDGRGRGARPHARHADLSRARRQRPGRVPGHWRGEARRAAPRSRRAT